MDIDFSKDLDIYEVDKVDYDAYFFRLPEKDIMKTTPREGFVIYKDIGNGGEPICGILTEQIMAMPANRYFIFNFLDEERLGPHKQYQYIHMAEEEYAKFLERLQQITKDRKEDA